ncbi:TnsA-like heteromeric transposase endonuclease subunit [Frankia sp. BMG5.23]|uniref:TnsA-like heteromeric transposase endonuclease subunit n=1 Tax=Frankia sp. BMG5.23 TaxID=683305 RepID=UPI000461509C|nr:TnsA-like heteromeric transposase endonuclease subunit [Frankia sp. BMG5.23]KDA44890.1 hypothetical protein BMG523Draft_00014 [Frankia sp. BMG5.23]
MRRWDGPGVLAAYLSDIDGESVAQKRVSGSAGADGEDLPEPVVLLRTAEGEVERPIRNVTAALVMAAVPWRTVRSVRGQSHFPGWYWSATTGGHVVYESRLELARLLVADFDTEVVGIAAQPFLLRATVGGRARRHVPDFLLVHADGAARLVNVKPVSRLEDPVVAEALRWPGVVARSHGWAYEIWSGAEAVYLANLRFLAGYRRPGLLPGALTDAVVAAFRPGDTIGSLVGRATRESPAGQVKAAALTLLWQGRLSTDLHRRLSDDSALEAAL